MLGKSAQDPQHLYVAWSWEVGGIGIPTGPFLHSAFWSVKSSCLSEGYQRLIFSPQATSLFSSMGKSHVGIFFLFFMVASIEEIKWFLLFPLSPRLSSFFFPCLLHGVQVNSSDYRILKFNGRVIWRFPRMWQRGGERQSQGRKMWAGPTHAHNSPQPCFLAPFSPIPLPYVLCYQPTKLFLTCSHAFGLPDVTFPYHGLLTLFNSARNLSWPAHGWFGAAVYFVFNYACVVWSWPVETGLLYQTVSFLGIDTVFDSCFICRA